LLTDLFNFDLPTELIAQEPAEPREAARLLLIGESLREATIADLPDELAPGDRLILNDTRVIPTRFAARRGDARVEVTLVEPIGDDGWWALARPARRLHPGDHVDLAPDLTAIVTAKDEEGRTALSFSLSGPALLAAIHAHGQMPLPPYIRRPAHGDPHDLTNYQPYFARVDGSVAAPTASLHFTPDLLRRLGERGVEHSFVTLHVGQGTFAPVKVADTNQHRMHAERYELPAATAAAIAATRVGGGRIIAVGSTALRTLETAVNPDGTLTAGSGETGLFITPGYRFRMVDRLLTNFHLPRSTLLMLVAAFAGLERIRAAYVHAVARRFRFFSYGDACLIDRA
jgi:S-adenosylmethionine:tRNA ribosyltransferase-isomerase